MKKHFVFAFVLCLISAIVTAQDPRKLIDSLYQKALSAKTDSAYVLDLLAASSSAFEFDRARSQQMMTMAMVKADASRNTKLITDAIIMQANIYAGRSTIATNIDTAFTYAQKAYDIAAGSNLPLQQGWTNITMAKVWRLKEQNDKALQHNQQALMFANICKDDSLLVIAHIGLGNTLLEKSQKLDAFRNYMTALDLADQSERKTLLALAYRKLSDFYANIQQYEKSKDYLYKQLSLAKESNADLYEIIPLYSAIALRNISAKQYDLAEAYLDSAMAICDKANKPMLKLNLLDPFFMLYFSSNNPQKIFGLLQDKKDLIDMIKSIGFTSPIDFLIGAAYAELKQFDSAHVYYKKAEPFYMFQSAPVNRQYYMRSYADLYKKEQNWTKAQEIYQQVFDNVKLTGDLENQRDVAKELDTIYQRSGNFQQAHLYAGIYSKLNDSLQQLSKEKDLLSVEVENENKRKEREQARQREEQNRRHNIQYMGITVAIAAIFLLLTLMGLFKISKSTIKILGFFAFIFLFEFIILLADNQIHHWTHGEPWKIILIKIGLIAVLLPLHHWLEEKVIHYLTNKDLLSNSRFKFMSAKLKSPADGHAK